MNMPCTDCICLAICKSRITNDCGYFTKALMLTKICSSLRKYVISGETHSTPPVEEISLSKTREAVRYILDWSPS